VMELPTLISLPWLGSEGQTNGSGKSAPVSEQKIEV